MSIRRRSPRPPAYTNSELPRRVQGDIMIGGLKYFGVATVVIGSIRISSAGLSRFAPNLSVRPRRSPDEIFAMERQQSVIPGGGNTSTT